MLHYKVEVLEFGAWRTARKGAVPLVGYTKAQAVKIADKLRTEHPNQFRVVDNEGRVL